MSPTGPTIVLTSERVSHAGAGAAVSFAVTTVTGDLLVLLAECFTPSSGESIQEISESNVAVVGTPSTAKLPTLFEPATGQLRVRGTASTKNAGLHPWLKEQPAALLEGRPPAPPVADDPANLLFWQRRPRGLRWPLGRREKMPPLRMLVRKPRLEIV